MHGFRVLICRLGSTSEPHLTRRTSALDGELVQLIQRRLLFSVSEACENSSSACQRTMVPVHSSIIKADHSRTYEPMAIWNHQVRKLSQCVTCSYPIGTETHEKIQPRLFIFFPWLIGSRIFQLYEGCQHYAGREPGSIHWKPSAGCCKTFPLRGIEEASLSFDLNPRRSP